VIIWRSARVNAAIPIFFFSGSHALKRKLLIGASYGLVLAIGLAGGYYWGLSVGFPSE